MSELKRPTEYWNDQARHWQNYQYPLIPSAQDVEFQMRHVVRGGSVLILGATKELCAAAVEIADSVTAVDYAADVIDALRQDGVQYVNNEWGIFFNASHGKFDTIMTDGGLLCLDFPKGWGSIIEQAREHLNPQGFFTARIYTNAGLPSDELLANPDFGRFMAGMQNAQAPNWMINPANMNPAVYGAYDMRYALPPQHAIEQIFQDSRLKINEIQVPQSPVGRYFPSYAAQNI